MTKAVPALVEGRDQLDARFPNREHGAEGFEGDAAHQGSPSSHNADKTGNPEYRDGDAKDEVRAWDADRDLKDPGGTTMEQVVQHMITLARAGVLWWIRYIIYNGRIWHRRDGFVTRVYTGSNQHGDHCHVNNDFTQAADEVRGTNWRFGDLGAPPPRVNTPEKLAVDDELGPKTIRRWQEVMKTTPDGKIDPVNSQLVRAVQKHLKETVDRNLVIDGQGIKQDGHTYKTVFALQRYLKSPVDGKMSVPKSLVVGALQRRLNENRF